MMFKGLDFEKLLGDILVQLLMGLTDEELENVDAVEGNEYERVTVGVVREVSLKIIISMKQHFRCD